MTVFPFGIGLALHHYEIAALVRAIAHGYRSLRTSRAAFFGTAKWLSARFALDVRLGRGRIHFIGHGGRGERSRSHGRAHRQRLARRAPGRLRTLSRPPLLGTRGAVDRCLCRRATTREAFIRMVLDGDPARGMPGYRSNAYVVDSADDIYSYFVARAKGEIGPEYRSGILRGALTGLLTRTAGSRATASTRRPRR